MLPEPEFIPATGAVDTAASLKVGNVSASGPGLIVDGTSQVYPTRLEDDIREVRGRRVFPEVNQCQAVLYVGIPLVAVCWRLIIVMEDINVGCYIEDSITECVETTVFTDIRGLGFLFQQADDFINCKQNEQDGQQQCDFHKHHSLSSYNLFVQFVHLIPGDSDGNSRQCISQVFSPVVSVVQG